MENIGRATAAISARLREIAPGKPLRYVVVSHHHSDHLGGISAFAGPATTVLVAPGHLSATRRAASTGSGDAAPNARIEAVGDQRTITDDQRRVEVYNVGTNPHTLKNLLLWLPQERMAFQGDLFYFDAGGVFAPVGREAPTRFFARWPQRMGLEPVAVFGVHNTGVAGPNALKLATQLPQERPSGHAALHETRGRWHDDR
ncbi:MAG: MBL fold metallo-hydrolase [Gemmatimonadaceae bacterium]